MSNYTIELRRVAESYTGQTVPETYPQIDTVIASALPKIFDFDFPIFDENYRIALEKKIVETYYFRELCCTPVSRWKWFLRTKLNNLMPYYNQLYESQLLSFNPLVNVDYKREYSRDNKTNETGSSNRDSSANIRADGSVDDTNVISRKDKLAHSDTPQGSLVALETGTYMSDGSVNQYDTNDTGKTVSTNNTASSQNDTTEVNNAVDSTEKYIENITGKNTGESYAKMLVEFRESFLNIDMMLLDELETLFWPFYDEGV